MVGIRVLLVEDDEFLREIYTDSLTQAGFAVTIAVDGPEALEKIKTGNWDVLLQDIILPHLDGIEVVKQVKADPALTPLLKKPIIFLTNLDNEDEMKQALALAQGYIVKSKVTPAELVKQVNDILMKTLNANEDK